MHRAGKNPRHERTPQQNLAHATRFLSNDATVKAQEGHQGVPLDMAETATTLSRYRSEVITFARRGWPSTTEPSKRA
ncbi:hypothetical protein [Limnohabitans sp.]|uniref:hypothetical protein n=1 Tax=Limnohabitans sp. TaxID=1907725 RepID=UPI0038621CA2